MQDQNQDPGGPAGRPQKVSPGRWAWLQNGFRWSAYSRRRKILTILVLALLVGAFLLLYAKQASAPFGFKKTEEKIVITSPLTGLELKSEALAKRPVTAIMIENSPDARPQSGLKEAGVVFEAIAEGGVTRFIALYQEAQPQYVGPIRSLRPYYIDFATPFDAGIAHVGGSPQALKQIRKKGKDLDQFFNSGAYWRQISRLAPHNVYTSFKRMDALNKAKGYKTSKFETWARKSEEKPAAAKYSRINLTLSGPLYNASFRYNKKDNSYTRYQAGAPHLVTSSVNGKGKRITPKVVVALVMSREIVDSSGHNEYDTVGGGRAFIFQDGRAVKGKWKKKSRPDQFVFSDAEGNTVKLNPGQVWVTIVDAPGKVKYGK